MKISTLLIVTAILVAPNTSAFAKNRNAATQSQTMGYAYVPAERSMDRSDAIRTCSAEAAKWRYSDWQTAQLTTYRNCMTQHGQPFE